MRSFIAACAVAVVLAVGAFIVLEGLQEPASEAFASHSGTRI